MDHPLVPVLVDLVGQGDDVALLEAQLAVVLGLEVIEGFAAGLVQGGCGDSGDTSAGPHTPCPGARNSCHGLCILPGSAGLLLVLHLSLELLHAPSPAPVPAQILPQHSSCIPA